jgi:hypothetical protein
MKTFKQFRKEASFATENLMLEAKGFGEIARKRRKAKKEYESKRIAKINLLKKRTGGTNELWKGLE